MLQERSDMQKKPKVTLISLWSLGRATSADKIGREIHPQVFWFGEP